ncbi:MAG TPA: acyl-homoserine-lactone synthase [Ramlibacter sp.]|uniref:acyl-homoserine-lactone synthase n=1 Tax=Ramlibacter sp. TaxID=1917967 RepID=UPI002CC2BC9A|nr:acyl-homoserine-lactone synthase [Ramlibacter sp.]HVZ45007.1 acyl-homoserine-lactone synthase [Ramlibacter sp.]
MDHRLLTCPLRELAPSDRAGMFRLRARVFAERLGWSVQLTSDGLEMDRFDELPEARYIVARASDGAVDACWRLLPTTGPNMLRDVFAPLLHGNPVPHATHVWELSRFAVDSTRLAWEESAGTQQLGFGELSVALMAESVRWAASHGVVRFVTVTTTAIERMLRKLGVDVRRLGAPLRVGAVMTVACAIELNEITRRAVLREETEVYADVSVHT